MASLLIGMKVHINSKHGQSYAGQSGIIRAILPERGSDTYEVELSTGARVWFWEFNLDPALDYRGLAIELLGRYESCVDGLIDEAGLYGETEAELRAEIKHYKEVLGIGD